MVKIGYFLLLKILLLLTLSRTSVLENCRSGYWLTNKTTFTYLNVADVSIVYSTLISTVLFET